MSKRTFEIQEIDRGWFQCVLALVAEEILVSASYLSDWIGKLTSALSNCCGCWPENESNPFVEEMEPAVRRWRVTAEQDDIIFTIKYDGDNDENSYRVNRQKFLEDFVYEMTRVLKTFGLSGYRYAWGHEFPLSSYLQLRGICQGRQLRLECVDDDFCKWNDKRYQSNVDSEIQGLSEAIWDLDD